MRGRALLWALALLLVAHMAVALNDYWNKFCGQEDCYELLGIPEVRAWVGVVYTPCWLVQGPGGLRVRGDGDRSRGLTQHTLACNSREPQDANTTTIRTAYRKLSLHWHPDKVRPSVSQSGTPRPDRPRSWLFGAPTWID